jgi:dihydrodipicolinate synthase/N-acetylneuraminate lyase
MSSKSILKGVVVPSITPFKEDGEVDEPALEPYLDFLAKHVNTISVCAIYGSGILMRPEQRMRVAEIAVRTIKKRASVAVFVGTPDTDTAVLLAQHAEKAGAQAITCVAPFYYRQVDEALFRHFQALIQAVSLPVYAYDSPVYAGNALSIGLLKRLRESGLAGVITGAVSYGLEHIWSVLNATHAQGLEVLSIRDGLALPAIMNGAVGFESGVANFYPELVMDFYRATFEHRYDDATVFQDQMLRLRDISHGFGRNIPTLHALIAMRGFGTGVPRRPFFLLSDEETAHLRTQLSGLDFQTPF